ncbi:MAG: ferredoxin [Acidimicrobiales bacterium]
MPWVLRGLRNGIVTTRYPRRPDGYGPNFRGAVTVLARSEDVGERGGIAGDGTRKDANEDELAALCPTGAIAMVTGAAGDSVVQVDRGRCILCGRCVDVRPDLFGFSPVVETAAVGRSALVVPSTGEDDAALERLRDELRRRTRALRRSIHVRHVDAGSDGSEEWEVAALLNPVYDVHRLGIFFTASPRHADLLLVTGAGTAGMAGPLRRTFEAMPDPKVVVATGVDAVSGGLVHPTYATSSGVGGLVPVDVWVPGSPPSPFGILHGILLGIGLLPATGRAHSSAGAGR